MKSTENTDKTTVKTYIPTYQKKEWETHATELGMSQSEFIRTMVQAGRQAIDDGRRKPQDTHANPRGETLEERVLEILASGSYDFKELVEILTTDLENNLESALDELKTNENISQATRGKFEIIEHQESHDD